MVKMYPMTTATTCDGRKLDIRPLEAGDKALIARGLERLSEESRYRRFLAPKAEFSSAELAYLTELDHRDHEALVAIDPGSGEAVGVARYVRLTGEPDVAEPAVVVVDEWQRRGVGSLLIRRLITRAREEGLTCFRATLLRENRPAIKLFEGSERLTVRNSKASGPEMEVEFELRPETVRNQLLGALRAAARGELAFKFSRARTRT
jgi:GNAT superfamily N-acetyltransferase